MTDKEALKLALEALKKNQRLTALKVLEEALAKKEQGEPVAYRYKMPVEDDHWVWNYCTYLDNKNDPRCEPLYTTPQQRKPLTDDEFTASIEVAGIPVEDVELVYAIKDLVEAAHGIKE